MKSNIVFDKIFVIHIWRENWIKSAAEVQMKKKKWRIGGFGVVSLPLMSLWLSIDGMCDANAPYEDIYVAHPQFFCSTGQIEFFCFVFCIVENWRRWRKNMECRSVWANLHLLLDCYWNTLDSISNNETKIDGIIRITKFFFLLGTLQYLKCQEEMSCHVQMNTTERKITKKLLHSSMSSLFI